MNVIFINVKDKIYKLEMRFRIYAIRISNKFRISNFGKIINLIISFRSSFEFRFLGKIIMRDLNVKFARFILLNEHYEKNNLF